jgi:membrane protease subunit (stomatin/prohibitin family)
MRRRRGPGLIGTAVVVGGAAHMGARSAQRSQQEADQEAQIADLQAQQMAAAAAPAAAPAQPDVAAEIQKFAALKDQGVITEEEFAAKKKQILGI